MDHNNNKVDDLFIINYVKTKGFRYSKSQFRLDFPNAPNPYSYYLKQAGKILREEASRVFYATTVSYYWKSFSGFVCLSIMLFLSLTARANGDYQIAFVFVIFTSIMAVIHWEYYFQTRAEIRLNRLFQM